MRVISFYLPQYHNVEANNKWWGEGFTDWVPTKKSKPCFEGHYQPHEPLNDNYYDLLDVYTLKWQSRLMAKYGVDGQAFYHYWFKSGKQILEKPAELLLKEKEINLPFCFYWANESWVRSWSKFTQGANPWMDDKKECDESGNGVLMLQEYGGETEWKSHFNYLLPFFKDSRYIKVDGKPLFIIYKSSMFPRIREMINCWKKWAEESGLGGLYIIGAYRDGGLDNSGLDAQLLHEPPRANLVFYEQKRGDGVTRLDYDKVWNYILNEYDYENKTYYSGFTGYDDTPRRGKRGIVLEGSTPEKYKKYIAQLMAKNHAAGLDITFVNAWNEWGEGMHLEPDKKFQFQYLKATLDAKNEYHKYVKFYKKKCDTKDESQYVLKQRCDKFELYMNYFDTWMTNREKGLNMSKWFENKNISKILLYGYGNMGRHLEAELKESCVEIIGIIDKQKSKIISEKPVFLPEDNLPKCDAIIVSAFFFYDEIKHFFDEKYNVISLKTIINEIVENEAK